MCVEYVINSVYLQELTFDRVKLKKKNKNKKRKLKNCKFCRGEWEGLNLPRH